MQFRKRKISLHFLETKNARGKQGAIKKRSSYAISCSSLISYIHVSYVLMPIMKYESDRQRKLLNGNLFLNFLTSSLKYFNLSYNLTSPILSDPD